MIDDGKKVTLLCFEQDLKNATGLLSRMKLEKETETACDLPILTGFDLNKKLAIMRRFNKSDGLPTNPMH